jgi:hypothetical protein
VRHRQHALPPRVDVVVYGGRNEHELIDELAATLAFRIAERQRRRRRRRAATAAAIAVVAAAQCGHLFFQFRNLVTQLANNQTRVLLPVVLQCTMI